MQLSASGETPVTGSALQAELVQLYQHFHRRNLARERAGAELSQVDYRMLKELSHTGPCRAGDLAVGQGTDPSTVSRRVASLLDRGLIVRTPDEADRRAHVLSVTDAGRAALGREAALRAAELTDALAGWSASDLDALTGLLHRLNDSLASAGTPTKDAS